MQTQDDLDSRLLESRIAALERQVRWWKRGTAVMGVVLAGVCGIVGVFGFQAWKGAAPHPGSEEVTARRFVAVDGHGNRLAVLGDLGNGVVSGFLLFPAKVATEADLESAAKSVLKTLGENGASAMVAFPQKAHLFLAAQTRKDHPEFPVDLSGDSDGASLTLLGKADASGNRPSVHLNASGYSPYGLADAKTGKLIENTTAGLAAYRGAKPGALRFAPIEKTTGITVYSRKGRYASIDVSDADQLLGSRASLSLVNPPAMTKDAQGKETPTLGAETSLSLSSDGSSSLEFQGKGLKHPVAEFSVDSDESPRVNLYDAQGKLRAALGTTDLEVIKTGASEKTAPSSLTLFDKKGKLIWRAP